MAIKKYRWVSEPRTQFEPLEPEKGMPKTNGYNSYLRPIDGHEVHWMCYCVFRYDWLMRTLPKLGVSVEHFQNGGIVPQEKCQEIAKALKKLVGNRSVFEQELLDQDIKFYLHCGGIRIHGWKSANDI